MARADDRPDVDFVVSGANDGFDEDLFEPELRDWSGLQRARVPLAVAAVVGVVIAGAVTISSGHHQDAVVSAPSTPPTVPTPSGPVTAPANLYRGNLPPPTNPTRLVRGKRAISVVMVPSGPDLSRAAFVAAEYCPKTLSCVASSRVPAALDAALRRHLPGVEHIHAHTVVTHGDVAGSTLLSRHITARAGGLDLAVLVRRLGRDNAPIAIDSDRVARQSHAVLLVDTSGLEVAVEATGPRRQLPTLAELRRLAREHGLLAGA